MTQRFPILGEPGSRVEPPWLDHATPEQAAEKMREVVRAHGGDPEGTHIAADELLCDVLRRLGYGDMVNIFLSTTRWYA
jgi:hypothetical protein